MASLTFSSVDAYNGKKMSAVLPLTSRRRVLVGFGCVALIFVALLLGYQSFKVGNAQNQSVRHGGNHTDLELVVSALTPVQETFLVFYAIFLVLWLITGGVSFISNNNQPSTSVSSLEQGHTSSSQVEQNEAPTLKPIPVETSADKIGHSGQVLRSIVLLLSVVFMMLMVDGPFPWHSLFAVAKQPYERDLFLFMCLIVIVMAGMSLRETAHNETKPLQREQTDEWRGFMQIGFVLYHYFAAKEAYNLIRVFIAAYVFLTGFGNFSFFWVKRDFSFLRVLKMLLRLNLLVILVCVAMNKPWMLYYVCPLHTFNFFVVYATMSILPHKNTEPRWMAGKFICVFLFLFLLFDVPGVFDVVFVPLFPLVQYNQSLHEWHFRATLDHYAVLWGMLAAYFYPVIDRWLHSIESRTWREQMYFKMFLFVLGSVLIILWFYFCFNMDKKSYNTLHPIVSFAPLLGYIILRNLSQSWRGKVSGLFAASGRITLETYLLQFHIWLSDDAKGLMQYVPTSQYPLLNFAIATVVYLLLSHWCFNATIHLNDWLVPNNATFPFVLRRFGLIAVCWSVVYLAVSCTQLAIT